LWIEADQADKNFYQGILQVAVALYHLSNENWRGAVILMGEGISRLYDYQPGYADVDVESFVMHTSHLHQWLQRMGAEQVAIALQQLNYGTLSTTQPAINHSDSLTGITPGKSLGVTLPLLQKIPAAN
jgi:hypothetical protein